jgi:hypothetical protein
MKPDYAEHQGNDGEENTCKAWSVDKTGYNRLMGFKRQGSQGAEFEEEILTAMTVLNDQSRYPSLSPNAVDTKAISFVALVLTSPDPTLSENVASCEITEATYA